MPKAKTRKSIVKKVRTTKTKKVMRRYTKQNHFNSKQTGSFKRKKRKDQRVATADEKNLLKVLN